MRHLRTQGLWVQEARVTGRLSYLKVLGTKNPSDILTKHVDSALLDKHLETISAKVAGGRADSAPTLDSVIESYIVHAKDSQGELRKEKLQGMHVSFSSKVDIRPVPAEGRGRSCRCARKMRKPSASPRPGSGGADVEEGIDSVGTEIIERALPRS